MLKVIKLASISKFITRLKKYTKALGFKLRWLRENCTDC